MIDLHNHLLAGVDDGAADLGQTRAALLAYREQGVRRVLVTPHVDGSLCTQPARLERRLAELDHAWGELNTLVAAEFSDVEIARGAEVMLDAPGLNFPEPRLRINGTDFVLVEFPHMQILPRSTDVLFAVKLKGITPVVAHPERYSGLDPELRVVEAWKRTGALVQVNAGSLVGAYGRKAEARAWQILAAGTADLLASDHHARGTLHLAAARDLLIRRGAEWQADLLLRENPGRILGGDSPLEVPPLQRSKSVFWSFFSRQ
jgi:protein-tyrosine phosphatase